MTSGRKLCGALLHRRIIRRDDRGSTNRLRRLRTIARRQIRIAQRHQHPDRPRILLDRQLERAIPAARVRTESVSTVPTVSILRSVIMKRSGVRRRAAISRSNTGRTESTPNETAACLTSAGIDRGYSNRVPSRYATTLRNGKLGSELDSNDVAIRVTRRQSFACVRVPRFALFTESPKT